MFCENVVEAIEVESHRLIGVAFPDVLAASFRNALLHSSHELLGALEQMELVRKDVTGEVLGIVELEAEGLNYIGSYRGAFDVLAATPARPMME